MEGKEVRQIGDVRHVGKSGSGGSILLQLGQLSVIGFQGHADVVVLEAFDRWHTAAKEMREKETAQRRALINVLHG